MFLPFSIIVGQSASMPNRSPTTQPTLKAMIAISLFALQTASAICYSTKYCSTSTLPSPIEIATPLKLPKSK